jgi:hypothetical protein
MQDSTTSRDLREEDRCGTAPVIAVFGIGGL